MLSGMSGIPVCSAEYNCPRPPSECGLRESSVVVFHLNLSPPRPPLASTQPFHGLYPSLDADPAHTPHPHIQYNTVNQGK